MNLKAEIGNRRDAWDYTADSVLAEIVLDHIRTGSTQLAAFQEASTKLGRTPAACGFRWNGVLRKQYHDDIGLAKQARKSVKNMTMTNNFEPASVSSSTAMRDAIEFLRNLDDQYQRLRKDNEELIQERDSLVSRVKELESKSVRPSSSIVSPITPEQLEQDSKTLIEIMNRARQFEKK